MDFHRGTFRVRGDVLEIFPADYSETAVRVEFFGDEIDRITEVDILTGEIKSALNHIAIFPASHYVVPIEKIRKADKTGWKRNAGVLFSWKFCKSSVIFGKSSGRNGRIYIKKGCEVRRSNY